MKSGADFDEEQKNSDAKDKMRELLEILNAKYIDALRNDPLKEAEFLYSQFSPFKQCIKTTEKFLLKDILSLVQTNILKMYIEKNDEEKIYEFFNAGNQSADQKSKSADSNIANQVLSQNA